MSLAELRDEFGSTLAILAAHMKEIDRAVLRGIDADMAEEPPRERLFDVLMRRLEALAPHKEAVRSLMRSADAQSRPRARAQRPCRALAAMDADRRRHSARPARRAWCARRGSRCCYASVLRTWVDDDDPGLARTMAALDRALARGQRWSGFLDDLCRFPSRLVPRRGRAEARAAHDDAARRNGHRLIYTGTRTVARRPPSGESDKR